jgi:hypothetical protein
MRMPFKRADQLAGQLTRLNAPLLIQLPQMSHRLLNHAATHTDAAH